ncbi:YciI family protein [Actomonas aquatica]|uniref:YciI family protein n=1 Tax=Actomonas aquatica TaxID=2866162 RepID=A0ABZ1C2X7_9BACT|nr:YciI family protein [Opitutus sp. WL0086]WRQ85667.1 YciI family protein [Opitutus sp. WL0086]
MSSADASDALPQFLLLFREPKTDALPPSPEELQALLAEWTAWADHVGAEGKYHSGNPLEESGAVLRGPAGEHVTDGPFIEAKEFLGGYFLISAADLNDAITIARGCPGLRDGMSVEVRPILAH